MAGSAHATLDAASREGTRRASAGSVCAVWPSAAVAAVFTLAQLVLVRPGLGLGWDETVYVSQVSGHAPASFFSAPRARGVSLLVAPVAAWSSSTVLLRVYLAVLSGLALFLALRAWRGLFPGRVLALAGALFASLWVTLFYGPQAMPNYWVAVAALAAVGCFLRARAERTALWGLAGSAVLMAWMRPVDAVWATLPLLALGLTRRHRRALLVLVAGLAAGAAEWVIEAYVRYGGPAHRLSDGSEIQGGLGWHVAVVDQLRSLGGRTLCRPCTGALPHPLLTLWWFALPLLAVLALAIAVRARRTTSTALPLACAATAAFPYLFLIGYAAPRFLLPAYALLAVPAATPLTRLLTPASRPQDRTPARLRTPGRARRPAPHPGSRPARRPTSRPALFLAPRLHWSPDQPSAPSPAPAPTTSPAPAPTTSPAPAPTTSPDPAPTASPAPSPAPTTSPSPAPAPTTSPAPSPAPTASPDPAPTTSPDPAPTTSPTASPDPDPARASAPLQALASDSVTAQASARCQSPRRLRRLTRRPARPPTSAPLQPPSRHPLVTVLVCAVLVAHLAVQLAVLVHTVGNTAAAHREWARTAVELGRRGIRPPCLVTGHEAIPIAFAAGCSSGATAGPNANITGDGITRTTRRMPVATLVRAGSAPPGYARDWPSVPVGAVRLYYAVPGAGP